VTLREQVVQARIDDPNRRAAHIAADLDCSRERVRQLLKLEHLDTTVPGYVPTKASLKYGPRIKVIEPQPPIPPMVILEQPGVRTKCPRCSSTFLYTDDDGYDLEVKCLSCGQIVTFIAKRRYLN